MRGHVLFACMAVGAVMAAGCTDTAPVEPSEPVSVGMRLPGEYGGDAPGSLLSAEDLPTVDRRLSTASSLAARITYVSTSGVDGSRQVVTGTVFAPAGSPPDGGWPVIAYGHPSTGTRPECAPSLDPMLLGMSQTVTGLVRAGYVVAMSDYQGLGRDGGHHPYLDATTEGHNLIDAVRASRKLVQNASSRWAAFGGSQGGQAAWAANELAGQYATDLQLVGSASFSAPLAIDGFVDAAVDGTLTPEQRLVLVQILGSLAEQSPDLSLDDYRRGTAAARWDTLMACRGPQAAERNALANEVSGDDLRPVDDRAAQTLRTRLQEMSLPRVRATAPMLVVYGGQDQVVPPLWTDRAIEQACRMGDIIAIELQPDRGHGDVDGSSTFPWINQRFADVAARNDCPAFVGTPEPPQASQ
jgi:pimeloyl-ACP methyl ester carboxylesterase